MLDRAPMISRILTAGSLAVFLAFSAGCTASTDPATDDQAPETPESAEEAQTSRTTFTRLDEATAAEVADVFAARFDRELTLVLGAHPDIQTITKTNVGRLTQIGTTFYMDLKEAIELILADLGQASAKPSTLRARSRAWALGKLAPHVKNGIVRFRGIDPLCLYEATKLTEEQLSIDRYTKARGVNLPDLRAKWSTVQGVRGNLDSAFLRPVKVSKEPTVAEMKKHFGIKGSLQAWGWQAIDDFHQAGEGPDGAAQFEPIADSLKHSIGIKKRFFFVGGGEGWSNHVLVVMDEKNQLFGFSMGYSE